MTRDYDNSIREFKALCKRLAEGEPDVPKLGRPRGKDFDESLSRVELRKQRRKRERERRLPKDRICPQCGDYKPGSKQWYAVELPAICLACHRREAR